MRRPHRLDALTGLRFVAAAAILAFHRGAPLLAGAPAWAERVRQGGHVWVGLFYVLSGFVLAWSHPTPMSALERRAFWAARVARLYPAYLLAFVLTAPFAIAGWSGPLGSVKAGVVAATALLLVQAWIPPIARAWNAPGWSTSVVLAFYAVFPFAAARLARLSRRGLWLALASAWALSLAFPLAWLGLSPDGPVGPENLVWQEPRWLAALKFHPIPRLGEFAAGVVLGLLHRRGLELPRRAAIAGPLALAAAVGVLAWAGAPFVLLHNGLLAPLFGLALLALATGEGPLARLLASAPARALGDASFALYVLQEPLWLWARRLAGDPATPATPAFVVAYAALAIAASVAVSRVLERPAGRILRAALEGGARPARAAGVPPRSLER